MHAAIPPITLSFWRWALALAILACFGLNHLLAEPGVHSLCATYPPTDFPIELCTVCKVFEVTSPCVDTTKIDSSGCPLIYIPVCGCNGVTYGNTCEAIHWGGVTSWRPGECGSVCNGMAIDFDGFNSGGSLTVWTFNDHTAFPGGQVTSWLWSFGNGQTSNEQNPTLNFLEPGDYEVCLFVSGQFVDGMQCGGSICKTIHVPEKLCIDPTVIDSLVLCAAIYEPVCGCDGLTYYNECVAYYVHGVTSWTPGICGNICINPAWIDTPATCIEIYDPVCGCDDVTYDNECFAQKNGVTSWKKGACCINQSCRAAFTLKVLPNRTVLLSDNSLNAESWVLKLGDGAEVYGHFDSLLYSYANPGVYQICLEISNFAGTCTDVYCSLVDFSTSKVRDVGNNVTCYIQPNPVSDRFSINTPGAVIENVTLFDLYGKIMLQRAVNSENAEIFVSQFPDGMYLALIQTDKGPVTRKIAVQR
jgi:hypothetical protein